MNNHALPPRFALRWILAVSLLGPPLATLADDGAAPAAAPAQRIPGRGTIEGTVRYIPDAERPWRLGRYYIQNRSEGQLAEAVVALAGPMLDQTAPPHTPITVTIDQKNFQFTPETVAIRTGDSVRFLNSDDQLHNVKTFHPQQSFNVSMNPGGTHVETFAKAGRIQRPYQISCVYHSAMRAWIYVFDHPYFQVTAADGRFRLQNVPPGEYTLDVVHPAGELRTRRTLHVGPDETVPIDIRLTADDKIR